jgi:hypothetical protein
MPANKIDVNQAWPEGQWDIAPSANLLTLQASSAEGFESGHADLTKLLGSLCPFSAVSAIWIERSG